MLCISFVDTTRLQPVVLQLHNYINRTDTPGHHQASAGGTSTSELYEQAALFWTLSTIGTRKRQLLYDC